MSVKGIAIKSMNLSNTAYTHTRRGNDVQAARVLLKLRNYLNAKNLEHADKPRDSSESHGPAEEDPNFIGGY